MEEKGGNRKMSYSVKTKVTAKGDAWGRGIIVQPIYAVAGSNDTGMWSDSPCPSDKVTAELNMMKQELKNAGIPSKEAGTPSSNVFMGRRWLIVPKEKFTEAKKIADKFLKEHEADTKYIYGAD
jgi:hypothetical protein